MQRRALTVLFAAVAATFLVSNGSSGVSTASAQAPASPPAAEAPWPRTIDADGYEILVYQPQIDRWQDDKIEARAAVSIEKDATPQPTLGVIWLSARTSVDRASGLVALDALKIERASFPSDVARTDEYLQAIRARVPANLRPISLERVKASLAVSDVERQSAKTETLRNDAPKIIFSSTPALLVLVDGNPVLRRVAGTKLVRAINTRAMILLDEGTGRYYLRALDRWMQAPAIEGPWTVAQNPPAALGTALSAVGKEADLLSEPGPEIADSVKQGVLPAIFVSTTPAELLQSTGQAEYAPIPGTGLLYVRNMSSHVIIDTPTQDYYVLISGRWFRSKSLADGPWEYVANSKLPADFAKIPDSHPKGEVLSSVNGTPQAQEAMIDNQIPQTAAVDRKKATAKIAYDGTPQLKQIEGTSLRYVVNSATPVIQVGNRYYAVDNGVWFLSNSLSGPWVVADEVPADIYSIPASAPVHNVTYVRVYDSTPEYVYVGYTPGYYGTVLAPDGVVVYGTGYYYPGWTGDYWYPWLPTYGYGAGFAWGAATGFAIGFISGAVWHGGPWNWDRDFGIGNNVNFDRNNIYNRWSGDAVHARVDARDRDGTLADRDGKRGPQEGRAIADRDGKLDPGKRDGIQDKGKAIGDKGKAAGDKGKGIADKGKSPGDKGKADGDKGKSIADKGKTPGDKGKSSAGKGKDVASKGGKQGAHKDLYAGKDGHVYQRGTDGWQKHDGQKFAHEGRGDHGHLDRAQGARHHGEARHNVAHRGGGPQIGGGGRPGGGFQGGGGGGRGGGGRGGGRR